ncbi:hypothetical protein GSB9_01248 [Flavobacteriaceae bacterium GSB9]|nr:hypothetical protein GSB9_01248 [Flavobacteriaceae bacterium GSB9]
MKPPLKTLFICFLSINVAMMSCREEEMVLIETPEEDQLLYNSAVANLMQRTSMNDGSIDNIIDNANCYNIKRPVTLSANNEEVLVKVEDDLKIIEHIFDDSDDDIDILSLNFPVKIILSDFSEITVNNTNELNSYSNNCNGENEIDDDIECLDFIYPITASSFNSKNEIINTVSLESDKALFNFINNLTSFDLVTLNFPLSLKLLDNTKITVNNLTELESTIKTYQSYCDEDDDFDYNDDDCNNCTPNKLTDILVNCSDWSVDQLERYGYDYDDYYDGYKFNFSSNGTVSADYYGDTNYGTWEANGSGNNITVTINIPSLPYCNNDWRLHEISEYSDSKVDFRVGGDDRLRYKNNCD